MLLTIKGVIKKVSKLACASLRTLQNVLRPSACSLWTHSMAHRTYPCIRCLLPSSRGVLEGQEREGGPRLQSRCGHGAMSAEEMCGESWMNEWVNERMLMIASNLPRARVAASPSAWAGRRAFVRDACTSLCHKLLITAPPWNEGPHFNQDMVAESFKTDRWKTSFDATKGNTSCQLESHQQNLGPAGF